MYHPLRRVPRVVLGRGVGHSTQYFRRRVQGDGQGLRRNTTTFVRCVTTKVPRNQEPASACHTFIACGPHQEATRTMTVSSSATKPKLSLGTSFTSAYQLSKPILSALVVGSGTAGFLMAGSPVHFTSFAALTVGTFLTAFSANTLNQCYEVKTDALMVRTAKRPLPSGKCTVPQALGWAAFCGVTGYTTLALGCNQLTAILGVGNIALYSMVYTPMKQTSHWNTWVGSVVGAIPPLMGWAAATGDLAAFEPWIVVRARLYLVNCNACCSVVKGAVPDAVIICG